MMLTVSLFSAFAYFSAGTREAQQAAPQDSGKAEMNATPDVASSPIKGGKTPPGSPAKSKLQSPGHASRAASPTKAQPQTPCEDKRSEKPPSQTKIKYRMICQCGSTKCRKYLF